MSHRAYSLLSSAILFAVVTTAAPVRAAERFEHIHALFAAHGLVHVPVAIPASSDIARSEALFLELLFEEIDGVILANKNVLRWFGTDGREGSHPTDYRHRTATLAERIERLEPPVRAEPLRDYVIESIELQRQFVSEWAGALESGEPFASPLVDEYAYHEGLHRSHRLHLKIYAELLAVFPRIEDDLRDTMRLHLQGMGLR